MKTIVYILLGVAATIGIIAVILYLSDDSKRRKAKLDQLAEAREAKADKKLLREIEEEYKELTNTNSKSDASEKNE